MSLAGRNAMRGSTVTVYRPTVSRATDGSGSHTYGAPIATGLKLTLDKIAAEFAQKLFGEVADLHVDAIHSELDQVVFQTDDAVVVTNGFLAGEKYLVKGLLHHDAGSRSAHQELGLRRTTEAIP